MNKMKESKRSCSSYWRSRIGYHLIIGLFLLSLSFFLSFPLFLPPLVSFLPPSLSSMFFPLSFAISNRLYVFFLWTFSDPEGGYCCMCVCVCLFVTVHCIKWPVCAFLLPMPQTVGVRFSLYSPLKLRPYNCQHSRGNKRRDPCAFFRSSLTSFNSYCFPTSQCFHSN